MVFSSILNWLRLKHYQYNVTLPCTLMTPNERIALNTVVILLLGMIIMATYLYLPGHIATVSHRATFYFFGNESVPGVVSKGIHSRLGESIIHREL